jgi:hypothetical protein
MSTVTCKMFVAMCKTSVAMCKVCRCAWYYRVHFIVNLRDCLTFFELKLQK